MNELCAMWSRPWHALQRDLASGLGGDAAAERRAGLKAVSLQSTPAAGNSWLGRARLHGTPLPRVRQ
jgi:hypothetical protein